MDSGGVDRGDGGPEGEEGQSRSAMVGGEPTHAFTRAAATFSSAETILAQSSRTCARTSGRCVKSDRSINYAVKGGSVVEAQITMSDAP